MQCPWFIWEASLPWQPCVTSAPPPPPPSPPPPVTKHLPTPLLEVEKSHIMHNLMNQIMGMVQQRCDVKHFSYKEVWLLQAPTSKFCFCPRVLLHVHEQDTDPMSPCMHGMNIKMVAKIQLELRWGARMEGGGEWMGGGWGGGTRRRG